MGTRKDGFWKILTTEQAWYIRHNENIELYALHDDGSESLIYEDEELEKAIGWGESIGIEASEIHKIENKSIL